MGRKQRQLKGVLSYYKVEMESIARSALHFEIVGMEKHIVTLLYGPMTAEQKSTVKQKSTIRPNHVLRALNWLVQYNSEWKKRYINLSKIRESLQQPVAIDSTYAVTSEDSNVETTESFEVFSPDGSMMELTGGQENINKFKDLVAENVQNGYNLEFHHKVEKLLVLTIWKITLLMHVFFSFHMEEEALMNCEKSLMAVSLCCQLI